VGDGEDRRVDRFGVEAQAAHEPDLGADRPQVNVVATPLELQEQRRHGKEVPDRGRRVGENGCHH
jgi:hypothetical protein